MKKKILIGICIILGALLIFEGYYYIFGGSKADKVTADTSNNSPDNDNTSDTASDEAYLNELEDNLNTAIDTLDEIENTEASLSSTVE